MAYWDYGWSAPTHPFAWSMSKQARDPQPGVKTRAPAPAPAAAQPSWLDRLYDDYRTKYAEAKGANEERYQAGLSLLGYDKGKWDDGYMLPGGSAGVNVGTGGFGMGGAASGGGSGMNSWGGSGPIYSPQAAAVNQDAMRRGIYNTQSALNSQGLANSLAATEANLAVYDRQYRADVANRDYQNQLMNTRLRWLESPSDPYPDPSLIYQLASGAGQGSTRGINPDDYGGGYGGGGPAFMPASSIGYSIPGGSWGYPTGGGYTTPSRRRSTKRTMDPVVLRNTGTRIGNAVAGGVNSAAKGAYNIATTGVGDAFDYLSGLGAKAGGYVDDYLTNFKFSLPNFAGL